MKLDKLIVHRLPGMPGGFELKTDATVSVIIGPNGSGKSSLTRAVRHLLWTEGTPGNPFSVEAFFTWEGEPWKATREEGMPTRWMHHGQPTEAPDLPGDHVARCYELGLLDLVLPAGGEVEQQLAGIINKEMSGGVNLSQIAEDVFSMGPRLAATRSAQMRDANRALNALIRQQKLLFEQEKELANKERDLEQSHHAAMVHDLLEKLKFRNQKLIELEAVRFQINTFEKGQEHIRPDDNDTLASLTRQHLEKDRQAQMVGTELAIRQKELQALDLPSEITECGLLARQVAAVTALQADIQLLQEKHVAQEAILKRVLMELDPAADDEVAGPQPGKDVYTKVTKTYSRLMEMQSLAEALEALLALPDLQLSTRDPQPQAVTESLLRWLNAPDADKSSSLIPGLTAAVVAASSGYLLRVSHGDNIGIVVMGVGATLAGHFTWQWFQARSRDKHRQNLSKDAFSQCQAAGISLDLPLQRGQVQELLNDETQAKSIGQTHQALRDNVSGQYQRQNQKLAISQDLLEQLRQEHGLALDREMPDLIHMLNVIPRFREAKDEIAALEASIAHKKQQQDETLVTCGTIFTGLGFEHPASVLEAEQFLADLASRLSQKQHLLEESQRDEKELKRLQEDLKGINHNFAAFWDRLGVEPQKDDHLVRNLVNQLPQWKTALAEEAHLKLQTENLGEEFRSQPAILDPQEAEKLTEEELDQRLDNLLADTQIREDLRNEITRINLQVEQARDSLQVAEAQALQNATQSALNETRDLDRQNTFGRLLLEGVQKDYHHASRPKVLAQASNNFRDFTQGLYELQVLPGPNQNGIFAAFDGEKQENLGLAELSDGTRSQLLLAVRLAFIAVNEGAAKPPIFLDESLTSSDPERFAAIADKLAGWAASHNRQVFYLSSNPHDAKAWESALESAKLPEPNVIDLAQARNLTSGQTPTYDYEAPFIPSAPGAMTAPEYAEALAVPALEPWRQNTEAHLWYVLQDDLPQLHHLLVVGTKTLGKLLSRKDEMQILGKMSSQKLANLAARGHCLDAFFKNWRIGRNRPVTTDVLISSGAIGATFMDKCRQLLKEVDGDSTAFLAGLRSKKVKRFSTKKIELLENFLLQENYLDPHEVLPEEDLLGHVFSAVQPEIKAGSLHRVEVRTLVLSWWELLKSAT